MSRSNYQRVLPTNDFHHRDLDPALIEISSSEDFESNISPNVSDVMDETITNEYTIAPWMNWPRMTRIHSTPIPGQEDMSSFSFMSDAISHVSYQANNSALKHPSQLNSLLNDYNNAQNGHEMGEQEYSYYDSRMWRLVDEEDWDADDEWEEENKTYGRGKEVKVTSKLCIQSILTKKRHAKERRHDTDNDDSSSLADQSILSKLQKKMLHLEYHINTLNMDSDDEKITNLLRCVNEVGKLLSIIRGEDPANSLNNFSFTQLQRFHCILNSCPSFTSLIDNSYFVNEATKIVKGLHRE